MLNDIKTIKAYLVNNTGKPLYSKTINKEYQLTLNRYNNKLIYTLDIKEYIPESDCIRYNLIMYLYSESELEEYVSSLNDIKEWNEPKLNVN